MRDIQICFKGGQIGFVTPREFMQMVVKLARLGHLPTVRQNGIIDFSETQTI